MRHYNVPGVSIAVIHKYTLEWAKGYGVLEAGGADAVTTETLFQAASISKPVTAMGILSLAQEGRLKLDGEANQYLSTWRIPEISSPSSKRFFLDICSPTRQE
jgi:CubicO group peptidase (beta-lactamase class C family)